MWAVVPMAIISAGTSKLYHYAYPFLPPVALAAGYLVALVVMLAPVPLRKVLEWAEDRLAGLWPSLAARAGRPAFRAVASGLIVAGSNDCRHRHVAGELSHRRRRIRVQEFRRAPARASHPAAGRRDENERTRRPPCRRRPGVQRDAARRLPRSAPASAGRQAPDANGGGVRLSGSRRSPAASAGILFDMPEGIWHPLLLLLPAGAAGHAGVRRHSTHRSIAICAIRRRLDRC